MISEFREFAYAKINLGLKVLPKRNDGFHNLEGIFHTVSLADELIARKIDGYGKCNVFCKELQLPVQNTVFVAYNAFCQVTGIVPYSVDVEIRKKIPSGGGLGGGSSDAAAIIRILQKMHKITLNTQQIDQVAGLVGSDVFFFLRCDEGKGAAIVSGRGELVKQITYRSDLHILLVFPNVFSSTREAYSLVDEWFDVGQVIEYPAYNELQKIYNGSVGKWTFKNTFTIPLSSRYQEIDKALKCIRTSGALYSEMTGSGSTVFGVYASKAEAENAKNLLECEGFRSAVAS